MSAMTDTTNPALFDVTIICTTDDFQASYWMDRLSSGVCKSSSDSTNNYPMVIAVSEDWSSSSGAGNGLGTLYAFQKACNVAKEKYGADLAQELMEGKISAALYHTAGKGTRLAPLPASENNNKPGVVSSVHIMCMYIYIYTWFGMIVYIGATQHKTFHLSINRNFLFAINLRTVPTNPSPSSRQSFVKLASTPLLDPVAYPSFGEIKSSSPPLRSNTLPLIMLISCAHLRKNLPLKRCGRRRDWKSMVLLQCLVEGMQRRWKRWIIPPP